MRCVLNWKNSVELLFKGTIPSRATNHFVEGVETTGEKKGSLNNQLEPPSLNYFRIKIKYSPKGRIDDISGC